MSILSKLNTLGGSFKLPSQCFLLYLPSSSELLLRSRFMLLKKLFMSRFVSKLIAIKKV